MEMHTVTVLIHTSIAVLVMERLIRIFYEKRKTSLSTMTLLVLIVFFGFSLKYFVFLHHPVHVRLAIEIPVSLAGYFIITLNYESSLIKRLIVAVSSYLLFMAIGTVIVVVSSLILPIHTPYDAEDLYTSGLIHIALLPLAYLTATLFSRFQNIRKNPAFFPAAVVVPILVILVLSYPFFSGFVYFLDLNVPGVINLILLSVFMMGATFLIFYLYDTLSAAYENKLKSALHTQEKEYYFTQYQLMQESVEQMKALRHDMKSQLATLKDYSINGKPEDITNYLNRLMADIEKGEVYSNTGNIAFDSIINYKLRNAQNDNIKLDLRMSIPPVLNIEAVDVVTILGNLLDNALDAVAKVSEKIIRLDIALVKGGLFAKIENSFNGEIIYSDDRQILTSKGEDGHGYGLKNIKKSVEKYDGHMKITHTDSTFSVGIFLYTDDNQMPITS